MLLSIGGWTEQTRQFLKKIIGLRSLRSLFNSDLCINLRTKFPVKFMSWSYMCIRSHSISLPL